MRISDWSSDVCSSDLRPDPPGGVRRGSPLRYLADGTVGQRDTEHLGHRERFRWKVEVRKWRLMPPPPLFRQGNRAARGAGVAGRSPTDRIVPKETFDDPLRLADRKSVV